MLLSYRHAFHAGGPSDVFKHVCVLALLQSRLTAAVDSNRRIKRSWLALIETHSGAGLYSLGTGLSLKLREHEAGISRLIASWDASEWSHEASFAPRPVGWGTPSTGLSHMIPYHVYLLGH